MTKTKHIIIWSVIGVFILITLIVVSFKHSKEVCKNIIITISDSTQNSFVDKNDVLEMLYRKKKKIIGYSIDSLNVLDLEKILYANTSIKKVEVYKTFDGLLKIDIKQRNPVVRIINEKKQSYYIDDDALIMPLSNKYTSRVIIANGHIFEGFTVKNGINIAILDSTKLKRNLLKEIYSLVQYINSDDFLKSFIEQVYINRNKEVELVPKIGEHIILFGTFDDYEEKFSKLIGFYKNGLNRIGWNKYKTINIKFKNQVVCEKREDNT